MGGVSGLSAIMTVQKMKKGGVGKLSISQITQIIVNLPDANQNLSQEQFDSVLRLYKHLRLCKSKALMDMDGYLDTATHIVRLFDSIAPYEKYSGNDESETVLMLEEMRKNIDACSEAFQQFAERVQVEAAHGEKKKRLKRRKATGTIFKLIILVVCLIVVWKVHTVQVSLSRSLGYSDGYDEGYGSGYSEAYETALGMNDLVYYNSQDELYHLDRDCLHFTGTQRIETIRSDAIEKGYSECYSCCERDAYSAGLVNGFDLAWDEAWNAGWEDGSWEGYQGGYEQGYADALVEGYHSVYG